MTFTVNTYGKTVAVADAGVLAGSKIVVGVSVAPGRDVDEFEMAPVYAQRGAITAGVGFDIFASCPSGDADGAYLLTYTRS